MIVYLVDEKIEGPHRKIYIFCRRTKSMPYREIKVRNNNKYYYRAISLRKGRKVVKRRYYLGKNLSPESLKDKARRVDATLRLDKSKKSIAVIKDKIISVLKRYRVKRAGIFGSYARGENKEGSDVDILIEPPKGMGLAFVALSLDLEKSLGKKVDVLTYDGISPYLKKSIMEDEQRVL